MIPCLLTLQKAQIIKILCQPNLIQKIGTSTIWIPSFSYDSLIHVV
jgi:hypothetical protein